VTGLWGRGAVFKILLFQGEKHMSSTVTVSTEINLSSETINDMVLEVVDLAQFLGLPLKRQWLIFQKIMQRSADCLINTAIPGLFPFQVQINAGNNDPHLAYTWTG
jgi:hypothetical protein